MNGPREPKDRRKRSAAPLSRARRHPPVEYSMLNRLLAELHKTGSYIDGLVLHMEKGNLPVTPELRAAQADNRKAIAAVLERLNGGME